MDRLIKEAVENISTVKSQLQERKEDDGIGISLSFWFI
jgi:hypothetical protein